MKKKNGFTVVDFLALIGALAIVIALLSPFVIKGLKDKEKKDFIKKTEELIEAASKVLPKEEQVITILNHEYTSADNLVVNKNLPLAATIKINKENQISIAAQDGEWCIRKDYDEADYTVSKYNGKCMIAQSVAFAGTNVDIKENDSNKDGLYLDDTQTSVDTTLPFSSKYYYRGSNPSNYLVMDKKCYRIINVAQNNSLKIIYEGNADSKGNCTKVATISSGYIGKNSWNENTSIDKNGLGNWYDNMTTARTFLENSGKSLTLTGTNKTIKLNNIINNLTEATYYVGTVNYDKYKNQALSKDIMQERTNKNSNMPDKEVYSYNGLIGLINVSDYLKASLNESCSGSNSAIGQDGNCSNSNYLYKAKYKYWTMNPASTNSYVWAINNKGVLTENAASDTNVYIRPVLYVNNEVELEGTGTENDPYKIIEIEEEEETEEEITEEK